MDKTPHTNGTADTALDCELDATLKRKLDDLRAYVRSLGSVAIAFSGGVDSTLLLAVAHDAIGDDAIAVTGRSPAVPAREIEETRAFCDERNIRHIVVNTYEFEIEGFERNPVDRCYICKREIMSCIARAAAQAGVHVIAEGSNLDDEGDYRPGFRAVQELGVASPLREAKLHKNEIRALAKHLGLAAWNKPAFACLNSRFAYGDLITPERLAMVDAAEEAIRALGFSQVRVRLQSTDVHAGGARAEGVHGETARIEVPAEDIERFVRADVREAAVNALKEIGFAYVALDLQGYRTGSMNETIGATGGAAGNG